MRDELPEVAKLAMRVLASVEEAVTRFARRHRYSSGSDLRAAARAVARCTRIAWRDRNRKLQRVYELSEAVDELKLELMLAEAVRAFRSTAEMEAVARIINELGRQVGGWLKHLHMKGQNERAESHAQRAPTLSSRAAQAATQ